MRSQDLARRTAFRLLVLAYALISAGSTAGAHDFWLQPSSLAPEPGSTVAVGLRVGQNFEGDPVPRNDAKVRRFVLLDARGETALAGEAGSEPAGSAPVGAAGIAVAGYMSVPTPIVLDAEKFEVYLKEEGLEHVVATRRDTGLTKEPGKEIYSRCAKAILRVGGKGGRGAERALGCGFELIPETLPSSAQGGTAVFKALSRGKPAQGIKVVALLQGSAANPAEARTGSDGRVKLRLTGPGVWLVKAVEMNPAPVTSGADWESIWASVVLEVGAR